MDVCPISMILVIHDPQESSWKIEWTKKIKTKLYGHMTVTLEVHPTGEEQCSRCRGGPPPSGTPLTERNAQDGENPLDKFIDFLTKGHLLD